MSILAFQYGAVCKLIAQLFPGQLEVVLHDLETGTIVAIEGAFSHRVVGDESLVDIEELEEANSNDIIGPYAQSNWDGEVLRSFTAILRNDKQHPFGLVCVNARTAALSAAAQLLTSFTQTDQAPVPKGLFNQDWRQTANALINQTFTERGVTVITAKRNDKVAVLAAFDKAGIFEMRGSPEHAAKVLGMSRASIYNLLKDARNGDSPAPGNKVTE